MKQTYIDCQNFTPQKLKIVQYQKKTINDEKINIKVLDTPICLDTETSHNHNLDAPICWVYHWAFSYGDNDIIVGRTPSQMIECFNKIKAVNNLNNVYYEKGIKTYIKVIIYVHNLSYDYCYIRDWFLQEYGNKDESIIATDRHKLITWTIDGFIFKCSYKLSNLSLEKWGETLNIQSTKKVGYIDYNAVHYQDTELTEKDVEYMIFDIKALKECLMQQLKDYNDTLATVPLTTTGYVRRDCRNCFRGYDFETKKYNRKKEYSNRRNFLNTKLNKTTYTMARHCFAGGLTHGNRFLCDKTITGNIRHRDFVSFYPSMQMCAYFPVTKFTEYFRFNGVKMPLDEFVELCKTKCVLAKVQIENLKVYDDVTIPYAQLSKFTAGAIDKPHFITDNGRILLMQGVTILDINEIDFKWLYKQYDFKITILNVYTAERGGCPDYIKAVVMHYFYEKTFYKEKEKELERAGYSRNSKEWRDNHKLLMNAKGRLNGIYGMTATALVRDEWTHLINNEWSCEYVTDENMQEKLDKYYNSRNNFMSYQFGVWTTAQARNMLLEFVETIGYNNVIYVDTDSAFYISTPETEKRIENKNNELRRQAIQNNAFIEYNNKKVYLNWFDDEEEEITHFKFLHAKCYAYIFNNKGKPTLSATIAGVPKISQKEYFDTISNKKRPLSRDEELTGILPIFDKINPDYTLARLLKGLDNLKTGYVFHECGGTTIKYVNQVPDEIYIDNHLTEISSGGVIYNVDKTLKCEEIITEVAFTWELV